MWFPRVLKGQLCGVGYWRWAEASPQETQKEWRAYAPSGQDNQEKGRETSSELEISKILESGFTLWDTRKLDSTIWGGQIVRFGV